MSTKNQSLQEATEAFLDKWDNSNWSVPGVVSKAVEVLRSVLATNTHENQPAQFKVSVQTMNESKGISFLVAIDRSDRPANAMPWDEGRITPCQFTERWKAEYEAEVWDAFLNNKSKPLPTRMLELERNARLTG